MNCAPPKSFILLPFTSQVHVHVSEVIFFYDYKLKGGDTQKEWAVRSEHRGWERAFLDHCNISGVYIFLALCRWSLLLLRGCPSPKRLPFSGQWEGVSLLVNMAEDEEHKGVQAHLVWYLKESAAHILKAEVAPVGIAAGIHELPSTPATKIESTNT